MMRRDVLTNGLTLLLVGGLMFVVLSAFQPQFYPSYGWPFGAAFTTLRIASIIAIIAGAAMLIMPAAVLVYCSLAGRKKQ
jgi:drug/metabolite transporter (DMT)-like permease